jgi:hypothetical protein
MSEDQSLAAPETKPCSMCREPIKAAAKKCIHCGSYQSWFGRLNLSATVLSLLVALVTVVGATAPVIRRMMTPEGPYFRFSTPHFGRSAVTVKATNIGSEPGTLDTLLVDTPQMSPGAPYMFQLDAVPPVAIRPGETRSVAFAFNNRKYVAPKIDEKRSDCRIELFDSIRRVGCDELAYMFSPGPPPPDESHGMGVDSDVAPLPPKPAPKWEHVNMDQD